MKKFIFTILSVSVFFIGLGSLVEKAGARFKSDERALEIIAQARQAIGGDEAIKNVRSMTIVGNAAQTFTIDGAARTEQGTLEINLQLPNQFNRMLKIGSTSDAANGSKVLRETQVVSETKVFMTTKDDDKALLNGDADGKRKVFVMKKDDGDVLLKEGELPKGAKVVEARNFAVDTSRFRQNELFRTTFALLLSAPEGLDATYKYVGAETVDGKNCDVISVESGNSAFKLFIDQSSHLPVMTSYQGAIPMVFKFNKDEIRDGDAAKNVIINRDGSQSDVDGKNVRVFSRVMTSPEAIGEYQVKFSDFRSTDGVQLPYRWTQTVNNQPDQNVDVTSYEINPANIAEKFKNERIMIRTRKAQ